MIDHGFSEDPYLKAARVERPGFVPCVHGGLVARMASWITHQVFFKVINLKKTYGNDRQCNPSRRLPSLGSRTSKLRERERMSLCQVFKPFFAVVALGTFSTNLTNKTMPFVRTPLWRYRPCLWSRTGSVTLPPFSQTGLLLWTKKKRDWWDESQE